MVKKHFNLKVRQESVTNAEPGQLSQYSYWTMGWKNFSSDCGSSKRFFSSPKCPHWLLDLPTLVFNGHQASLPRVKWPGSESDHLPPSGVEDTYEWMYTYTLPIHFQGMYRDNVPFIFTYNCVGSANTVIAFRQCKIQFLG